MRAYSMDLRQRVLADCDDGLRTKEVAAKYRVSTAWVRRLKQRRRTSGGEDTPRPRPRGRRPRTWEVHAQAIRAAVAEQPDLTLAELQQRLGLALSLTTLWRAVAALGLTVKKKSVVPPSRIAPTSRRGARTGRRRSRPMMWPG